MFKNYNELINNYNNKSNHNSFNYNINELSDIYKLYDLDLSDYDDYKKYLRMYKIKFNNIKDCYEFEKQLINKYNIFIKKYKEKEIDFNNLYNKKIKKYNLLSDESFIRFLLITYNEIYKLSNKIFNHHLLILDDLNIIINKLINKEDFLDMLIKGSIFLDFIEQYFEI